MNKNLSEKSFKIFDQSDYTNDTGIRSWSLVESIVSNGSNSNKIDKKYKIKISSK